MEINALMLMLSELDEQCRKAEWTATAAYSQAYQMKISAELHHYTEKHIPTGYADIGKIEAARKEVYRADNLQEKTERVMLKLRECREYLCRTINDVMDED